MKDGEPKPPLRPWLVLVAAIFLPGLGQVLNNMPQRGLTMLLFLLLFAMVTYQLTTPQHSWLGRHAGGVFIYGIMVLDAYRWAKYRWEVFRHQRDAPSAQSS